MFETLMRGLRRAVLRTLAALLIGGAVAAGYGAGMVWLQTGAGPTRLMWLVIAPLAALAALLSGAFAALWSLVPAVAAVRALEYLARAQEELQRVATQPEPRAAPTAPAVVKAAPLPAA
jgi:hypothetical protein